MRAAWIGIIGAGAVLAGCYESTPSLNQDEEKLFDAVMYLFTGIEDNTPDGDARYWHRTIKGRALELWTISKNGMGFSDEEARKKTRNSVYARYVYRLTSPERCTFIFEDKHQLSKGDSQEDFSAYSYNNMLNSHTFRFANAHTFEFDKSDDSWPILILAGPRVKCDEESRFCENAWNSQFSGMSLGRFDGNKFMDRRERALALVKKACPGKEF